VARLATSPVPGKDGKMLPPAMDAKAVMADKRFNALMAVVEAGAYTRSLRSST
jgi:hypothetical protein